MTVTGKTVGENIKDAVNFDPRSKFEQLKIHIVKQAVLSLFYRGNLAP